MTMRDQEMTPERAAAIIVGELKKCGYDVTHLAHHIRITLDDVAMSERAAEREMCAKIVDDWDRVERQFLDGLADAIRRGAERT